MEIRLEVTEVDENSAHLDSLKKKKFAFVSMRGDKILVEKISKLIMKNFPKVE